MRKVKGVFLRLEVIRASFRSKDLPPGLVKKQERKRKVAFAFVLVGVMWETMRLFVEDEQRSYILKCHC